MLVLPGRALAHVVLAAVLPRVVVVRVVRGHGRAAADEAVGHAGPACCVSAHRFAGAACPTGFARRASGCGVMPEMRSAAGLRARSAGCVATAAAGICFL